MWAIWDNMKRPGLFVHLCGSNKEPEMPSKGSGFYFYDLLGFWDGVCMWVHVMLLLCVTLFWESFFICTPSMRWNALIVIVVIVGLANYNISMTHNFPLIVWIESGSHVAEHTDTGSRGDAVRIIYFKRIMTGKLCCSLRQHEGKTMCCPPGKSQHLF